ncbi:hypothetical protein ACFLZB_03020 [Nanoarchaeota archaeon]
MPIRKTLNTLKRKEKKEYDYLLREFYEIKHLFIAIKHAEEALLVKNLPKLGKSLEKIKTFLRRTERTERRMARAYNQVQELLEEVEPILEEHDKKDAQRIKELVKQAQVYNSDLEKLDARGGDINKIIDEVNNTASKIGKGQIQLDQSLEIDLGQKIKKVLVLLNESLTDIRAFEKIIGELMHVDVLLYKKAALFDKDAFSEELEKMALADQASRAPFLEKLWMGFFKGGLRGVRGEVSNIDEYNSGRLKILLQHFPIYELGDEKDLNNIWIIAQHADHDIQFQNYVLNQFINHPQRKKVGRFIAALTDRILYIHEKKHQRYGTFATPFGGITAFDPIKGGILQKEEFVEAGGQKFIYGELTSSSLNQINAQRESIGIETLGERIKKFKGKRVLMWKTSPPSF